MASDVLQGMDFFATVVTAYWSFCISNFWTAVPITLGLIGIVYRLIRRVFR